MLSGWRKCKVLGGGLAENGYVPVPNVFLEESKEHLGSLNQRLINWKRTGKH